MPVSRWPTALHLRGEFYKLRSITIQKLWSFAPGTTLRFHDGTSVLLGRNASGKTALLHLVSMIARQDLTDLASESFELSYVLESSCFRVEVAVSHEVVRAAGPGNGERPPSREQKFKMHITRTVSDQPRAEATIRAAPDKISFEQEGECIEERKPGVSLVEPRFLDKARWPFGQLQFFESNTIALTISVFAGSESGYRFDEGRMAFEAMAASIRENETHRGSPHPARISLTTGADGTRYGYDYFPSLSSGYLDQTKPGPVRVPANEVDFLKLFVELTGHSEGNWEFRVLEVEDEDAGTRYTFAQEFSFALGSHRRIPQSRLSYGEQRLLAFLYHAACNRNFIIADELVNGFHHSWIESCLEVIQHKQCFLTSQNPLLINFMTIDSAEAAEEMFIQCERTADGQLHAANLPTDAARELYEGYELGIQHTGEILRVRGLW